MQKGKIGEKGDEVTSLTKIALVETSNNNFRCGLQTNYVELLSIFSGELWQRFKLLTTQLLQWLDYFSSF